VATALDVLRRSDAAADVAWSERDAARLARCRQVVQRLSDEDRLAPSMDVETAARLFWALTSQRCWEDLALDGGWPPGRWTDLITELLDHALLHSTTFEER
jgi:hypothetical protein